MDKLDLQTPNFTDENIQKIAEIFPNCVTESADGKVIDCDKLEQELSSKIVEGNKERYQLSWPGKAESLVTANTPINKTLRPCRQESKDFDNTENLYIEGDNLEVLKLLQETYLGKVKMIYIDPPYNTGKDFVYKDNFTQDSTEYDVDSGNKDEEGGRLVSNPDSNGRYHSDWLSMMYPRLKLARNLLRDDGVIFISINDNEVHNLRKVCDEIFGTENFIEQFVWVKKTNPPNNVVIGSVHEYVLAYAKNRNLCKMYLLPRNAESDSKYKNPDNDPRGPWTSGDLSAAAKGGRSTPSLMYQIKNTITGELFDPPPSRMWIVPKAQMEKNQKEGRIWWGNDGKGRPKYKRFLAEVRKGISVSTLLNFCGNNGTASKELNTLFGGQVVFETPKPTKFLEVFCSIATRKNDIVLDFFSGSAASAHAIVKQNIKDNGNRKFIMVQIPEPTPKTSEANKAGYKTISDIGKERIRRAGEKIKKDNADNPDIDDLDIGFRVLKVDSSNMKQVYYTPDETAQNDLIDLASNIKDNRLDEDLLFQVLLDWGVDLTLKIKRKDIAGKQVYFVDDNALAACFEEKLDDDFIKDLAKESPMRVVLRDSSFANDDDKINAEQIFKQAKIEVKVI